MVGTAALAGILQATPGWHDLPLEVLLFLLLTVLTALVGGLWPALGAAVLGSLAINWFFTEPVNTLTISDPQNLVALLVFLLVAVGGLLGRPRQ